MINHYTVGSHSGAAARYSVDDAAVELRLDRMHDCTAVFNVWIGAELFDLTPIMRRSTDYASLRAGIIDHLLARGIRDAIGDTTRILDAFEGVPLRIWDEPPSAISVRIDAENHAPAEHVLVRRSHGHEVVRLSDPSCLTPSQRSAVMARLTVLQALGADDISVTTSSGMHRLNESIAGVSTFDELFLRMRDALSPASDESVDRVLRAIGSVSGEELADAEGAGARLSIIMEDGGARFCVRHELAGSDLRTRWRRAVREPHCTTTLDALLPPR